MIRYAIIFFLLFSMVCCERSNQISKKQSSIQDKKGTQMSDKVVKSSEEWKKILTPEQYEITREKGTERPGTGKYNKHKEDGTYKCVCCDNELFSSTTKYDSGSGWPSFWDSVGEKNIRLEKDNSLFMSRVEVLCNKCDAHLGHVFKDGPKPTNLRYCINSAALDFATKKDDEKSEKKKEDEN